MNKTLLFAIAAASSLTVSSLRAEAPNSYQVTGPIVEVTDSKIVVMKGKDKWELARTADTKVTGDLKVGGKVTIEYSMSAKSIEAKADKADAKPADKKPAADKKGAAKPADAKPADAKPAGQ